MPRRLLTILLLILLLGATMRGATPTVAAGIDTVAHNDTIDAQNIDSIVVKTDASKSGILEEFASGSTVPDTTAQGGLKPTLAKLISFCYQVKSAFSSHIANRHLRFWDVIAALCVIGALLLLLYLGKQWCSPNRRRGLAFFTHVLLPELAVLVFVSGLCVYYVGYDYSGTSENSGTLFLRSAMSSMEMFLSKSNLIGIADNCRQNSNYMLWFALTHFLAVLVTTALAVICFLKSITDGARSIKWRYFKTKSNLYVFWGQNEKSYLLARDIYEKEGKEARIVFIEFPAEEGVTQGKQNLVGLLGLLSYNFGSRKELSDVKYVLVRSGVRPSEAQDESSNYMQSLELLKIVRFMKNAASTKFFMLSDDATANYTMALKTLDQLEGDHPELTVYCAMRRTEVSQLQEQNHKGHLRIIDDSHEAVTALSMQYESSQPINFVDIDERLGCVKTHNQFIAMIIGFNTTGQDALRFLYEFSAFPDEHCNKAPVKIIVCDKTVSERKGYLMQEIPALPEIEKNGEIEFLACNSGEEPFTAKLREVIDDLDCVVIGTGDDDRNLLIATKMQEFALQYRNDGVRRFKIFVRLYKESNRFKFQSTIGVYQQDNLNAIEVFGTPRDIYTKAWIVDDEEKTDAITFFNAYEAVSSQQEMQDSDGDSQKWDQRRDKAKSLIDRRNVIRQESQDRANCKHRYTKEKLLGLCDGQPVAEALPKWPEVEKAGASAEASAWLKRLFYASVCEHLRWNAAHLMMGYLHTDESTKSIQRKLHPDLLPWNELKTDRVYDYIVVKTTIALHNSEVEENANNDNTNQSQDPT